MSVAPPSEREVWDRHWRKLAGDAALFGKLASRVRRWILAPAVRHYVERYFPPTGLCVELGCGSGEASARVPARGRRRVALDLSLPALAGARGTPGYDAALAGDLHHLPFADGSVAAVWNLGVMEHFEAAEVRLILLEIRRILQADGVALLFWPPEFGLSRKVLAPIEWWRSRHGTAFHFFPAEVNRLRSRAHARATLADAGFETVAVAFTPRDAFIHLVVVGRKAAES